MVEAPEMFRGTPFFLKARKLLLRVLDRIAGVPVRNCRCPRPVKNARSSVRRRCSSLFYGFRPGVLPGSRCCLLPCQWYQARYVIHGTTHALQFFGTAVIENPAVPGVGDNVHSEPIQVPYALLIRQVIAMASQRLYYDSSGFVAGFSVQNGSSQEKTGRSATSSSFFIEVGIENVAYRVGCFHPALCGIYSFKTNNCGKVRIFWLSPQFIVIETS